MIWEWFWYDFVIILRWCWDDFRMISVWCWCDLGMILVRFLDNSKWFWDDFKIILGWLRYDFWTILAWFEDDFGMIRGLRQCSRHNNERTVGFCFLVDVFSNRTLMPIRGILSMRPGFQTRFYGRLHDLPRTYGIAQWQCEVSRATDHRT
jgi:hypothetical protein